MSSERPLVPALHVTETRQASFLYNPSNLDVVGCLIEREHSVSELADRLQLPLKNLAARVYRMVGLGLARVTGESPRRGRPVKRYRSVAERFLVQVPGNDRQHMLEIQQQRLSPFIERFCMEQVGHLRRITHGQTIIEISYDRQHATTRANWRRWSETRQTAAALEFPYLLRWGSMQLDPKDQANFMTELRGLVDRYLEKDNDSGEFVMFLAGVMPPA